MNPPPAPPTISPGLDWLPGLAGIDTGDLLIVTDGAPPAHRHVRLSSSPRSQAQLVGGNLDLAVAAGDGDFAAALIAAFAAAHHLPAAADPASRALLALAARVAPHDATVLIEGATGTGKEGLARLVHTLSPRRDKPLVAVNCAALPEAMLEATLFGHERGAFTGAIAGGKGLFRAAQGGTLFLDEVSELPLAMQTKLLRAVQEREVLPIGAVRPEPIDVRLIAAANRDLAGDVAAGRFRADLFYRLAVFPLRTLPLAERRGDVIAITAHWLLNAAHASGRIAWPGPAVLAALAAHDWPGNVRELGNVLDRALVLGDGATIDLADLVFDRRASVAAPVVAPRLPGEIRHHEDRVIRSALAETHGRRAAAERLGISERTLRYKLAAMAGRTVPAPRHMVQ